MGQQQSGYQVTYPFSVEVVFLVVVVVEAWLTAFEELQEQEHRFWCVWTKGVGRRLGRLRKV